MAFRRRFKTSGGRELDRGILLGLGLSFSLMAIGIMLGGGAILSFFDPSSIAIVVGGTLGATLVSFSPDDLRNALESFKNSLFIRQNSPIERIRYLVGLAHAVRTQGRLRVLEHEGSSQSDPFLKFALEMTVDGQTPGEVKRILETEMRISNDRSFRSVHVFETMGNYAPALGLIGTVIGLIQMLKVLDNPAAIGPSMATALVTTFYGAVLANLVFLPIAGKLRNRSEEEAMVKAITVEGILSVGNEENPMLLEQRLQSFLPQANA